MRSRIRKVISLVCFTQVTIGVIFYLHQSSRSAQLEVGQPSQLIASAHPLYKMIPNENFTTNPLTSIVNENARSAIDGVLLAGKGQTVVACDSKFESHKGLFSHLADVVFDPHKLSGARKGGETIKEVLNQKEKTEYFQLLKGFVSLYGQGCQGVGNPFDKRDHLHSWFDRIEWHDTKEFPDLPERREAVVAVLRYEYANIYHTMTDWYNAFLVMKYYGLSPNTTSVLLLDAHPKGALDDVWQTLFSESFRVPDIPEPLVFRHMFWNMLGYFSPLLHHEDKPVPAYLEEFRDYFLERHGVPAETSLDCQSLRITFLFRKDYVAHPRNPSGVIQRKIANEDELVGAVKLRYMAFRVRTINTENMTMAEQLKVFSTTDMLIGMHGAGMTHALFLPQHAGLVELYPAYFSSQNKHFASIAKWRKLHYYQWVNRNRRYELPHFYTRVPRDVILKAVEQHRCGMCNC